MKQTRQERTAAQAVWAQQRSSGRMDSGPRREELARRKSALDQSQEPLLSALPELRQALAELPLRSSAPGSPQQQVCSLLQEELGRDAEELQALAA
jgi:hypothetical protein